MNRGGDSVLDRVRARSLRLLGDVAIVAGSLFLLLVALGASAFLSFAALDRAQMDLLSEQYHLAGRETGARIEEGLRFGRPLDQFLGLDAILEEIAAVRGVSDVAVADADGALLGEGAPVLTESQAAALRAAVRGLQSTGAAGPDRARVPAPVLAGAHRLFLTPLRTPDENMAGALVVMVPLDALSAARDEAVAEAVTAMLIISGVAAALLAIAAGRLRGAMLRQTSSGATARWRWILVPLVVLLSAQLAYAAFALQSMRFDLTAAAETSAARSVQRVGEDLDRLLALGLSFDRMPGLDARLYETLTLGSAVERLDLVDASGRMRIQVDRPADDPPGRVAQWMPVAQPASVARTLTSAEGSEAGQLVAHVNRASIAAGMADQALKMLTVAATSAFVMVELFILLQLALRRSLARAGAAVAPPVAARRTTPPAAPSDAAALHLIARPVMFVFVLSWALPLSFLPLKMRSLGTDLWGLPQDLVLALPISAEMGAALATAVLAGRMSDRFGWSWPFVAGLALSVLGGIGAALAPDGLSFVLARTVTGLGYGLAWMGLQGFVVQNCGAEQRGRALANLMAGILAGFIVGTAIGGILAEQLGRALVLWATGLGALAPLAVALVTLRPYLRLRNVRRPPCMEAAAGAVQPARHGGWSPLLRSPPYLSLLLLSVVPFSIAQVGLLYFAVPLHLDRIGAAADDAGRVLMVYGLVVIALGPLLSGFIDRTERKAPIVVAGGLCGGLGLGLLAVDLGLAGIFLAAAALSLSSTLIEPARAALVLRLPAVQAAGPASALGLQRAADKLGQMLGPMAIAMMLPAADIIDRVAVLGLGFAGASVLLALVLMAGGRRRGAPDHA